MDNNQLFNRSVHSVDGVPVNWLPLPEPPDDSENSCWLLQHLMSSADFYIALVEEVRQSSCLWSSRLEYCVKTADRVATLYHLAETADGGLSATCVTADGALQRPFCVRPGRSFPLFAADLLPLPWWAACADVIGHSAVPLGRVRAAWGPVRSFWAGGPSDADKFLVQSERLMDFCCLGAARAEEPLEAAHSNSGGLCCVATVNRQLQLRTTYCQSSSLELKFLDEALQPLTASDRLLLMCAMIYVWRQIGKS